MRVLSRTERAAPLLLLIAFLAGCAGSDIPVDAAPEDVLAHAQERLSQEKHFDAAETLEHFLRTYPGTASAPRAKLMLGDARYGLKEYILAEGEYQAVVSDFPSSPLVEEARYKIALCSYAAALPWHLDQRETHRALDLLAEFRGDHPGSRFLPEVERAVADCRERIAHGEFESGRFYEKRKRLKPAAIQYKFVAEEYPETPWAPRSAWHLAGLYVGRERLDDAGQWMRRIQRDWPDSEEAALAARALPGLGEERELSGVPADEVTP